VGSGPQRSGFKEHPGLFRHGFELLSSPERVSVGWLAATHAVCAEGEPPADTDTEPAEGQPG